METFLSTQGIRLMVEFQDVQEAANEMCGYRETF